VTPAPADDAVDVVDDDEDEVVEDEDIV